MTGIMYLNGRSGSFGMLQSPATKLNQLTYASPSEFEGAIACALENSAPANRAVSRQNFRAKNSDGTR